MGKENGCYKGWHAMLFLCLFFACSLRVSAQERTRAIFISSYSWETAGEQGKSVKAELGEETELHYEFMDIGRVDEEDLRKQLYEGLAHRLAILDSYDMVIVGDNGALLFAMEYQDTLFADIPIAFFGVDNEQLAHEAVQNDLITGILGKSSIENNIHFGLTINPEAKKVVAILDNSERGIAVGKEFYKHAESFPELQFSEINASELSKWDLQLALRQVKEDSILIYLGIYLPEYSDEEFEQIMNHWATVPVLCTQEDEVGQGFLGGSIVCKSSSGRLAAQMAVEMMTEGGTKEAGTVMESPYIYCVDEEIAGKFDMDMSLFPEETKLVNHRESYWERNREALIPGGILVGALTLTILFVLYHYRKGCKKLLKLEDARKIVEANSEHDFLTGLLNRSKFEMDMQKCLEEKRPCTVMMLDIDDFKKINDTYGHNGGDDALRQVAARLQERESRILTAYRYAGDEFIIILHSTQSRLVDYAVGQCKDVFLTPLYLEGKRAEVYGSIGIAAYPKDAEDMEQLIVRADSAMYSVKKNGKNALAFYQKE